MNHWLIKTEPESFSIDDLIAAPEQTTCWDGVRNYLARNLMRTGCIGDQIFFYHSSTDPAGIVGLVEVVRTAYSDHSAFDKKSKYYDAKASPEKPTWQMVDVRLLTKFSRMITLEESRRLPELAGLELLRTRLAAECSLSARNIFARS